MDEPLEKQIKYPPDFKFRAIFDQSSIGILFYDKNGITENANEAALKMLGFSNVNDDLRHNLFDNPFINEKKEELYDKGIIKFQAPLDLDKIKDFGLNPNKKGIIFLDYIVTVIDTGFLTQIQDITERKKFEKKLEESEAKYRNIVETANEGIMIADVSGVITFVNAKMAEMVGYTIDELIGMEGSKLVEPVEKEKVLQKIKDRKEGKKESYDLKLLCKNGNSLWTHVNATPIYNLNNEHTGNLAMYTDISEYRRAENNLINERELLQAIIDTIPVMITVYNPKDLKFQVNNEFERVLGWTNEYAKNNDLMASIFPEPEYREMITEYVRSLSTGFMEQKMVAKNGEVIITSWANVKIPDGRQVGIGLDIRESKKADEALKKSEGQLKEAQRLSKVGDWEWEMENDIVTWSDELYNIVGLDLEKPAPTYRDHPKFYTKESFDLLNNAVETSIVSGEPYNLLLELIRVDGEHRWVDAHGEPVKNDNGQVIGFRGTVQDITERKKAEEKYKLSQKLFQDIIDGYPDAIFVKDTEGSFITVNKKLEELLGIKREEVKGKTDYDIISMEDADSYREHDRIVLEKEEPAQFEEEADLIDGRHIYLANKFPLYDTNDKLYGVASISADITELKKAESEIRETLRNLSQSNKELEQFAYITSHDLREPLRMIVSFLQLLERRYKDQLDKDAKEFIEYAVNGAKRLDNMTNDLLQYSRITSEKRMVTLVDFEKVLEEALINLKVPIEESNVEITHDPLPKIKGDAQRKVQLFQNLIANAIKYRSNETPKIHISVKKEKHYYVFSIKDNGIGMAPEHLERIFTIFQRLHINEEYEGTGIGLAIAQKIVQQHDGEIWAESELGKGSTFYFTIPINLK